MKFYQIRYRIRDKFLYNSINDEKIRGACRIIGAADEATALQMANKNLEDDGWEIVEITSVKEIIPTYVMVERAYFDKI